LYIIFPFLSVSLIFSGASNVFQSEPYHLPRRLFCSRHIQKTFPKQERRSPQNTHWTLFSFIITIYGKEIHTAISSTRKNRRYSLLISGAL